MSDRFLELTQNQICGIFNVFIKFLRWDGRAFHVVYKICKSLIKIGSKFKITHTKFIITVF
jgi:hypothetical protein